MRRLHARVLPLFMLVVLACAGRSSANMDPGLAPALTVERFLQAANAVAQLRAAGSDAQRMGSEVETMARLFGTSDGSVLDMYPRDEVDQRMNILAELLRHSDYRLAGERSVPGRDQAVEVGVELTMFSRPRTVNVPFLVVRSDDGWLIERIDLEPITGS